LHPAAYPAGVSSLVPSSVKIPDFKKAFICEQTRLRDPCPEPGHQSRL
jgi:hypothetical protein